MADYNININAKDNATGPINRISGGLGGLTAGAGKFKAAIGVAGAAFAAFGAVSVIQGKIDEFDSLAKSARAAGAAASEDAFQGFQVMRQAMNEAGVDAGTFDRAMLNTSQRLQKGMEGGKGFAEIFDKLGDSVKTANGDLAAGPELLQAMINGLNEGTISTDEFAKVVGGRAGPLIQQQFASLNTSAEALQATLSDVAANSNIVSLDAAENAEVFNDNIGRLKEGMGQLLTDAITPLLPHLVRLSEEIMANMPAIIEKVQAAFTALEPVFSLIGTVLTDLVFPILSRVFEVLGNIATAIAPLVESAIPLLKTAFESLVAIVESIVGFFQGVAESLQGIYDKAIQLKDGVAGTFDNMADSVKNKTKDMTDSVSGWFNDMYMKVVGGSIVPDMVREVIAEFKRMDQGVTTTTQQMTGKATDAFTSLSDSIIDSMENGKLASGDFAGFFKDTMFSLVKDAMNGGNQLQSIFDGIFGGGAGGGGGLLGGLFGGGGGGGLGGLFGGGMGGIFSNFGSMFSGITSGISNFFGGLFGGGGGLGSLFGGFFANGGTLGAGKFGIAGEAGPELITGPATITPAAELGGAPSVNITIQAIDTQTGTEFLLKNKKQVESIIQNAYNRRGKQGIY